MSQIQLHKRIAEFFKLSPEAADVLTAQKLIGENFDARNFFFSRATPDWFDWLRDNNFLNDLREPVKNEGSGKYYYSPEMEYLVRVAEVAPEKFARFIQSFSVTEESFDLGILNRVISTMDKLPAPALKQLAEKARAEEWSRLLNKHRNSGYQYDGMFETLTKAGEWEGVLALAEALLLVQPEKENAEELYISRDNPFYVDDVSYSNVFSSIVAVPQEYKERALALVSKVIAEIVTKTSRSVPSDVFPFGDNYHLVDIDFFDLDIAESRGYSFRDDIKNLAATLKVLLEQAIGKICDSESEAKRLFSEYVDSLPESRPTWRLRLFTMSLCPTVFKVELRNAFFRLFEVENYSEIDSGAEYQKALNKCFGVLNKADQLLFIQKIFEYFSKQDEKHPDQKWHLRNGWETLSSISEFLTEEDKRACVEKFGLEIDPKYEPQPSVSRSRMGMVVDRSPVNIADYKISEIVEHLKTDWSPKKIREEYKGDDFLSPRNAEGLGDAIKSDLRNRTESYLEFAGNFFDRESMHPHYTYSLLRGFEEMLREKKITSNFNWNDLFVLYEKISESGQKDAFPDTEEKNSGGWLGGWIAVHDAVADGMLHILTNTYDDVFPFEVFRDRILNLTKYLFTINDPNSEKEGPKSGNLHGVAINSVKGRAFQVLTHFVYYDGKNANKNIKAVLKDDVKKLYLDNLHNEESLAVRFMYGHYIAPYFFRDKEWFVKGNVFESIFPSEDSARDKYMAAWEGYLTSNLYEELFELLKSNYINALKLRKSDYTEREYDKELDEALGTHIALAYVHYSSFTLESELFGELWKQGDTEKQKEFISFIGRHVAHRDDTWRSENKVDIAKLKELWDWVLKNSTNTEVFSAFGHWVAHERDSFEPEWLVIRVRDTVIKANGNIDWDYGITQQLEHFAEINPEATLQMLEHYLLDGDNVNPHRERWMMIDKELRKAIEIIYNNSQLKKRTYEFIDRLLIAGGQQFWTLADIVDDGSV